MTPFLVGYFSGRTVSEAGRDAMYRKYTDPLAIAWMASIAAVVGLAMDWTGVVAAAHDVSRVDAFVWGSTCDDRLRPRARHEHLERGRTGDSNSAVA